MPWAQSPAWPSRLRARSSRRRAQRRVDVEHARGQPLEELRVLARDAEVAQRHLRVGEGRARRRARAPRDRGTSARARGPRRGRSRPRSRTRRAPSRPARSRTRWRRLTIGSSTAPVVPRERPAVERDGVVRRRGRGPRKRARSVSHSTAPCMPALDAQHVDAAERRARRVRRGRRWQTARALGQIARGLDEQLAERRMREVVGGQAEHELGVARDLDLARPRAAVRERSGGAPRRRPPARPRSRAASRCRRLAVEDGLLGQEARDVVRRLLGASGGASPTRPAPLLTSRR